MSHQLKITLLVLFVFSSFAVSQDLKTEDSVFKCFPKGDYFTIDHVNLKAIEESPTLPLFNKYFPDKAKLNNLKLSTGVNLDSLPASLRRDLLSVTTAFFSRVKPITDMDNLKLKKGSSRIRMVSEVSLDPGTKQVVNKEEMVVLDRGVPLTVLRFNDLQQTLRRAIKEGSLVETPSLIEGRNVLELAFSAGGNRSVLKALPLGTDSILLAANTKQLKRMAEAAAQSRESLLDDMDYVNLIQMLPDLGAIWSINSKGKVQRSVLVKANDQNISSEEKALNRERIKNKELFIVNSWNLSNSISNTRYTLYDSREAAKNAGSYLNSGLLAHGQGQEIDNYNRLIEKSASSDIHGNMVIHTVEYGKELLQAQRKATAASGSKLGLENHRKSQGAMVEVTMDVTKK